MVSPPPVHAWLAQRGACLALLGLGQTWPAQHNGWGCSLCTCAGTAVQAAQQPVLGTTSAAPWVAHTPVQLCGAVFRARACACVRMSSCLCGYVCLPVCPSSAVLERACARARVRVCVCVLVLDLCRRVYMFVRVCSHASFGLCDGAAARAPNDVATLCDLLPAAAPHTLTASLKRLRTPRSKTAARVAAATWRWAATSHWWSSAMWRSVRSPW